MKYGIGVDLGSGSVGWAIVELESKKSSQPIAVHRLGIRRFDAGVSGDISGGRDESNATERRLKRGPRRQHWRRAWRIRKVYRTLIECELLPANEGDLSDDRHEAIKSLDETLREQFPADSDAAQHLLPYRLRALALDEAIPSHALGRALYSLAQRRGFLSNRKAVGDDEGDDGVVKRGIAELDRLMSESNSRTLGEYFDTIDPEQVKLRRQWTARRMFQHEFDAIWDKQSSLNSQLTDKQRRSISAAIFDQRPLKSQRHLVGKCELERYPAKNAKGEVKYIGRRCAFIACLPYQEFRLLQKVNDLTFVEPDGRLRSLSDDDCKELRQLLLDKLSEQGEMTFGAIRTLFKFKKSKEYDRAAVFNFESDGDAKLVGNRTAAKLVKILGPKWHAMSLTERNRLVDEMLQFESAEKLQVRLNQAFGFDEPTSAALSRTVLEQGFGRVSRRALGKLLPKMRDGLNFHDAKVACGYSREVIGKVYDLLPPVRDEMQDVRNPAVIRVLTEMRKVINGIIREMKGVKPEWIRVELARDLKHSRTKRQDIVKQNRQNEKARDKAAKLILSEMQDERYVTQDNILKIRLAEECGFVCPYSGDSIGMNQLVGDEPKFEIEHTIPLSRSLDNSFLNKLLCRTDINRAKGQMTPWEKFGGTPQYDAMVARVKMLRGDARDAKLKKFLIQSLDDEGFVKRQLTDTQYAARLATTYLATLYGGTVLAGDQQKVFPTSGRITAYLRQRWQLNQIIGHPDQKNRADHRHHAIDALVTALSTPSAVRQLSKAAERAEQTGDKLFAEIDPPFAGLIEQTKSAIESIAVSSRVNRKVNGAMHEETIQSHPIKIGTDKNGDDICEHHVRKPLESLSPGEVNDIVDEEVQRIVMKHLEASGKSPADTFKDLSDLPAIHGKNGRTTIIRRVRIRKSGRPMQIGEGSSSRYVNPGANHHMAVVAILDKDGKEVVWEAHLVTRFEAMTRVRSGQPVVTREYGANKRFKFSLCGGDYVMLRRGEQDELCRVVVISGNNMEFVMHSNANPSTVRKKSPGERIRCSVPKLKELGARKVDVLPTGRVIEVCEELK